VKPRALNNTGLSNQNWIRLSLRERLAELFSGLFFVAASRLNSPRLSKSSIEPPCTRLCQEGESQESLGAAPRSFPSFTIDAFTRYLFSFIIHPMRRAIYPGSFDPVTNGHLDIIERGCKLFDEIIIAILVNPDKRPLFSIEERREMLLEVTQTIRTGNCRLLVEDFQGLLVHYAIQREADAIVRGIRAISDYEYELQMALMNRRLEPRIETVFMMPAEVYSYVSSRLVKEVFQLGATIEGLVPPSVEAKMFEKLK
jgi:pantetheine-phosphate adenylyltransferase